MPIIADIVFGFLSSTLVGIRYGGHYLVCSETLTIVFMQRRFFERFFGFVYATVGISVLLVFHLYSQNSQSGFQLCLNVRVDD